MFLAVIIHMGCHICGNFKGYWLTAEQFFSTIYGKTDMTDSFAFPRFLIFHTVAMPLTVMTQTVTDYEN
jgi:hypothetical protein